MTPEGTDSLNATLLAAILGQLMLDVSKDLFPQSSYFDLTSPEKRTVAEHVRNLMREAQTALGGRRIPPTSGRVDFPPQREEEYL